MKKIYLLILILTGITLNVNAETNRIFSGNENAKITIIEILAFRFPETIRLISAFIQVINPKTKIIILSVFFIFFKYFSQF